MDDNIFLHAKPWIWEIDDGEKSIFMIVIH